MFYGERGELRQWYREGQEDRLSALGLLVNALILIFYNDVSLSLHRAIQSPGVAKGGALAPHRGNCSLRLAADAFRMAQTTDEFHFSRLHRVCRGGSALSLNRQRAR